MGGSCHQEGDYLLLNVEALEHRDYITEELKAANQLEWAQRMNAIHHEEEEKKRRLLDDEDDDKKTAAEEFRSSAALFQYTKIAGFT